MDTLSLLRPSEITVHTHWGLHYKTWFSPFYISPKPPVLYSSITGTLYTSMPISWSIPYMGIFTIWGFKLLTRLSEMTKLTGMVSVHCNVTVCSQHFSSPPTLIKKSHQIISQKGFRWHYTSSKEITLYVCTQLNQLLTGQITDPLSPPSTAEGLISTLNAGKMFIKWPWFWMWISQY